MPVPGGLPLNAAHYDRLARWGAALDEVNRERIRHTLELLGPVEGPVLDVGSGDGGVTNPLVEAGFDVTGVDISRSALSHVAGSRVLASLDRLPFADRTFEATVCAEVLEHLPDALLMRAEAEIERVTSRRIVISTPNREYLAAGLMRCGSCGLLYHRNLHVRSMDEGDHRALFLSFEPLRTIGIGSWRPQPLLTLVQQRLFGVYGDARGSRCPRCGKEPAPSVRPPRAARAVIRLAGMVDRALVRERAHWIATVYVRPDEAGANRGRTDGARSVRSDEGDEVRPGVAGHDDARPGDAGHGDVLTAEASHDDALPAEAGHDDALPTEFGAAEQR